MEYGLTAREGDNLIGTPSKLKLIHNSSNYDNTHVIFCSDFDGIKQISYLGLHAHESLRRFLKCYHQYASSLFMPYIL